MKWTCYALSNKHLHLCVLPLTSCMFTVPVNTKTSLSKCCFREQCDACTCVASDRYGLVCPSLCYLDAFESCCWDIKVWCTSLQLRQCPDQHILAVWPCQRWLEQNLCFWTQDLLCRKSALKNMVHSNKRCDLKHFFSVMTTKVVIPHADLHCCFPPCFSSRLAMLVEGFRVSKSLHFCSINVINSLSVGNPLSTYFICHLWCVWFSKHSTTSCDNMMSSNSCSIFNAFIDLKLLQNLFTNCLISPMSSLLIDFKPIICLTLVAAISFLFLYLPTNIFKAIE